MTFWLAVILVGGMILISMVSILWILARGSHAKRRWTLVGLLLNKQMSPLVMNAPVESASKSAKERREARKLLREQQSHLDAKSHAHHSHLHGGNWGTGHHGSFGGSHHSGGFDGGGGHHHG
jgi:uncharacterized membrane protein YgcG